MKRYYFHILAEECLLDTQGHVCQSDEDAVAFGRAHVTYLHTACGAEGFIAGLLIVDVTGRTIATLSADAVTDSERLLSRIAVSGDRESDAPACGILGP